MSSHCRPIIFALAALLFAFEQTCALAQEGREVYKLKATTSSTSRLSRTEVDAGALGALAPTAAAPAPQVALAATTNVPPSLPAETPEAIDKSYVQEYNVDWSSWIAKVADRWYYILRMSEDLIGTQFVTPRAALIQFTCYNNGQIGNLMLKQSSGDPTYDRMQMLALMQVAPLPPFPPGTHRSSITLVQGWESHLKQEGEQDFVPGSFGKGFPMEKVKQWVKVR